MALTQARAFGAASGPRYGSFAGRGAAVHPVGVLTQPGASGAHTGRRFGAFAGRGDVVDGEHPVGTLTQARSFGALTGGRYGSFAGRQEVARRITQARTHAAHSGGRYGAFSGRPPADIEPQLPPTGGGRRPRVVRLKKPEQWPAEFAALRDAEDDMLLLVIAQMIAAGTIH